VESTKTEINEYLFYEFAFDLEHDESRISEDWPFHLEHVGRISHKESEIHVLMFEDDEPYFALANGGLDYCPTAGMSLEDLGLQYSGSSWIAAGKPVNLEMCIIGPENVPSTIERRKAIADLVTSAFEHKFDYAILEGLFWRSDGSYLALIEKCESKEAFVLGTKVEAVPVGFPRATSGRRLAVAVGKLISQGQLKERL
jgi:hypothetical protein